MFSFGATFTCHYTFLDEPPLLGVVTNSEGESGQPVVKQALKSLMVFLGYTYPKVLFILQDSARLDPVSLQVRNKASQMLLSLVHILLHRGDVKAQDAGLHLSYAETALMPQFHYPFLFYTHL